MDEFYTAQEVADLLRIKKTTVYDLIKKNKLPSSKVGKQIRVNKSDLDEYLRQTGGTEKVYVKPVADASDSAIRVQDYLKNTNGLIIGSQDDLLSVFCSHFQLEPDNLPVVQQSLNVYDCLYSLYYEKIHAAFIPIRSSGINGSLQYMMPGTSLVQVTAAELEYGFYLKKGSRRDTRTGAELLLAGGTVMFGSKGSMSRIILDQMMKDAGISIEQVKVCSRESISDLAAAIAVENGQADLAIGSRAICSQFPDLTFVPVVKTDLCLVFDRKYLNHPAFQGMIRVLQSEVFQRRLMQMDGYGAAHTGKMHIL